MFKALFSLTAALALTFSLHGCKDEAKFGSSVRKTTDGIGNPGDGPGTGIGDPNDPNNPNNQNIGSTNGNPGDPSGNPGGDPGGNNGGPGVTPGGNNNGPGVGTGGDKDCVDASGNVQPVQIRNFPATIDACIKGDIATRGLYNFSSQQCEKPRFAQELTCTRDFIRNRIVSAGMSSSALAEFDQHATDDAVFFEGGCSEFTSAAGEKIVMVQFYKPPTGTYNPDSCQYDISSQGTIITGCYINATDASWASLNSAQKVERCFNVIR